MGQTEHQGVAVPRLSISGKLALLSVCTLVATLALVGLLFQAVLKDLRRTEAWTAIQHAAELVDARLADRSGHLLTTASWMAEFKSVAAVTHLVEAYETPQRYLPQLFDVEKKGLADSLMAQLPMTGAAGIAVYSLSHDLVAFGCLSPGGGLQHGYRSLVDGQRVLRVFRGDQQSEPEPAMLSLMAPTRMAAEPKTGFRIGAAGLVQYAQLPLLQRSPTGAEQLEGAVVAAALVDDRLAQAVSQQSGVTAWLVPAERQDTPVAGLSVTDVLAAAPATAGLWQVPHDQWHLGAIRREFEGGSLLILLGRGKAVDEMELRALNISVGMALVVVGLLVAPLTLMAGRRMIGAPLARITAGLDGLLRGERLGDDYLARRDEIGALAATLNGLLDAIKAREAELALSRAHYQMLYDRAPVGYAALATDGGLILSANLAFHAILKVQPGSLSGLRLADLCGGGGERLDELLQRLRVAGAVRDEEIELQRRGGDQVWLSLSMDEDDSVEPPLIRLAAIDISERKRAQQDLLQTLDALSRSHAELEEFARIAAHDLREPSRLVVSYAQLLERRLGDQLAGEDRDYLRYLAQSSRAVYQQVQDVLDFARAGNRDMPFGWVDCGQVVDGILQVLNETVAASGAVVTVVPLPTVYASPLELPRVFDHLIRNALKFRSPDRSPEIRISAEQVGGEWVFSIGDNGIGIDPAYFQQIFGVFRRLHARDDYPGTGIGLAICKRVVEHHKGRIWVESEIGKGSIFRFAIPQPARLAATAA